MADERQPWDQQDGEPNRWYQRFNAYRLLGTGRSIEEIWRSEARRSQAKRPCSSWYARSTEWQWSARATAYDQYLTNLAQSQLEDAWQKKVMGPQEVLGRLSEHGRNDIKDFFKISERWTAFPLPTEEIIREEDREVNIKGIYKTIHGYVVRKIVLDLDTLMDPNKSFRVKEFTDSPKDGVSIKLYDAKGSLEDLGKHHHVLDVQDEDNSAKEIGKFSLPADVLAPSFFDVYRDIRDHKHLEYVFYGGRGSTKSTFAGFELVDLLINNPTMHALAMRQVKDTLRDSVYAQLVWCIGELGLSDSFKCTTSPMEITYLPTGQKIYFRGADDTGKIKSIKTPFGYIGILWFEELDQFHGQESVRKIEQSVIRGGDLAFIFKSFNPPRTASNWANKYIKIPKPNQYQHHSTYLDVPKEWLGKAFLDEAEYLKSINPGAYEHEYLGIANGTGGLVFENLKIEKITDEQIAQFDHVYHGLDWGYYPDPAHYGRCHYDASRRILYLFGEYRAWKQNNRTLYDNIKKNGYNDNDLLIADSAEPKSVADFREYGATCRGAEKGPDSVKYGIKWMQGLTAIVIDPERCPYSAEEFLEYEYEQDPDGNYISEYPDKNNHAIDETRYATNPMWRKRGQ